MRQPVSAMVFPVTSNGTAWRFLLLRRVAVPRFDLPIFWQGITGGVEDDETVDQAATRELFEETGISGMPVSRVGFSVTFPMKPQWRDHFPQGTIEIVEHVFVCVLPEAVDPKLSLEHSEFAWLAYHEAHERLFYQGNKDALKAAHAWLTTRA